MALVLSQIVRDFAEGMVTADAMRPQAVNSRSKTKFQAGIGPHTEVQTVLLVMKILAASRPQDYGHYSTGVMYRDGSRSVCDLCLGAEPPWDWAIEIKMLRFLGDNGKVNDNILTHVLSPYPTHRSALTDCEKLARSDLAGRRAVLIYGFDHTEWPLDPALDAFETLARSRVGLGTRFSASFDGLVHPVHVRGRVFGWEVSRSTPPSNEAQAEDV